MREYTDEEIQCFLEEDRLDPETLAKVRQLLKKSMPSDFLPSDEVWTQVHLKTGEDAPL